MIRDQSMAIAIRTASEQVYDLLRERIVRNELAPGTPLRLADLASQLGVSTMPVRSALQALQADGLVRGLPHRGASVAPLELEDLELIQAVRTGIEGFAARVGADAITSAQLRQMHRLLAQCRRIASSGPLDRYLVTQWAMQDVCYQAAARPQLLEFIHQYRRRAERYVRLAVGSHALEGNLRFHAKFVEACQERDGDRAQQILVDALAWTVDVLRPVVERGERRSADGRRTTGLSGLERTS